MIALTSPIRPRSCAGLLSKRAKARFLFLIAFILPTSAQAQSHEQFTFSWLEPPQAEQANHAVRKTTHSPAQLDSHTTPPPVSQLEENFAPPVSGHKRVSVYDKLVLNQELQLQPASTSWTPKLPKVQRRELTRKLTISLAQSHGERIVLPSSNVDMRIISCTTDIDNALISAYSLEWDPNTQRYAAIINYPTPFLLSCSTTEPSEPAPADYETISKFVPNYPQVDPRAKQYVLEQIADVPWIKKLRPKTRLAQLALELNKFSNTALDPYSDDQSLLKTILLQKRGVCRHRAFAFVAIAQAWGYQARLIYNEAHAFAEVFSNNSWHLVDLGGAPSTLQINSPTKQHPKTNAPQSDTPISENAPLLPSTLDTAPNNANSPVPAPTNLVFIPQTQPTALLHRDTPLQLSGSLVDSATSHPIPQTLVTLFLQMPDSQHIQLATATTDASGFIQFTYKLPHQLPLGSAKLILKTPNSSIDF